MGDLLSIDHAVVRLGRALVLTDLTLSVQASEVIAVTGPNGSGKTTLLRLAAGLIKPSSGSVEAFGAILDATTADAIRARIGLVTHATTVHPRMTLSEHLTLVERLSGAEAGSGRRALQQVGLGEVMDRRGAMCSNGMLRRAEFARVLVTEPDLLLLDEAHVGLDSDAVQLLDHLVARVTSTGGAAVVVSHEPATTDHLTTRTVALRDGRITEGSS